MSRQTPYHPPQQQRPLAAPPPPTAQLPTEIAIVCVVDDSARTADRWNDIVKEGGYLDRFVQRLSAGAGVAKQLRLSLLSYSSQSSPLQTPITHTQYFLAPTEFWTSVRQPRPPTASGSNSSPPASPGQPSTSIGGGGEQGLLEGLVGGIELFDLHTSHPFVLPTPSPSPPYIPQHPIPSSASSTSSNTSPQHLSHLSPPNSFNNAQHSSSSSTHPQPSPRPNVERYLFVFLGDDPSPTAISSLPAETTVSSKKIGRWGKKPSSSAAGSSVGGGGGGGGKVRWNRTRKLDGVGWDELSQEMRKRGVRSSLVGMGVGTGEGEMKRLKELFKKNSFSSNDPAWFPTTKGDLLLLYGLDPTKTHLKRPHSQTSPPSVASPSSLASSLPQKRQRVAAPGGLPFPPPSVPSQTSNPTSSAALHAQLQQQQQQQRIPGVQDIQAHRIQAAQRMLANNPAAAAQLAARGQGMLPPSLGGVPGIPLNIQSQFAAVASVAAANNGGGAGGPSFDLASSGNAEALQQQWHRQRLQAQVSAAATTSSPVVPPPPSLPNHQQHQQQQQRPPQQQQSRPTVWSGDLGWQVSGSAKGQPNLGCRIIAASATKNTPEDFQPHLWGERIQISSAVSFRMDELKLYASKGTPCVGIRYSPDPMASAEERASGERSFLLLTNSLSAKQIAGVIKMGPPGCGMLVFPMSQTNKSAQNPSGSAQLMGMVFLRSPIPTELIRPLNSNAPHPNNSQQNPSHNQQQQQQHHQPLQPPNLTIKTGHQQQQQQQLAMERAQAAMILQKQQHQQKLQQLQLQQQQQQQQLQNQQQQHGQPNLNFPNGGINLASAGLYGGSGSVGAGMTGVSDQQMAEFLKSYPPGGQQQGGQQPRWP